MKMKTEEELIAEAKKNGVVFPVLRFSENPADDRRPGVYGRMAFNLLHDREPDRFRDYVIEGTLMSLVHKIDKQAEALMEKRVWAAAESANLPRDPEERSRRLEELREQTAQAVVEELLRENK